MTRKLKSTFLAAIMVVSIVALFMAGPAAAATGDIVGNVEDAEGQPLEGADVTLINETDGSTEAVATTDVNGYYSFSGMSDGNYIVEVEKTGFSNASKSISHNSSEETRADFSLTSTMTEYHNQSYAVDEDDEKVYIDVDDTNGTDAYVYFYATENATGNETFVDRAIINTDGTLSSANVTVDASNYTDYRVVLEATEEPAAFSSGTVSKLEGGGGATALTSSTFGIPNWIYGVVVVLGIGVAVGRGKL